MATRGTHPGEGAPRGTVGHVPVLLSSTLQALAPRPNATYIDATFGAGGHSQAILAAAPGCRVLGIDRDPAVIAAARPMAERHKGRLQLVASPFSALETIARTAGLAHVAGVLLDLGVSSMQLEAPERGFSFLHDGPLDMRMSAHGATAADVLNTAEESQIAHILSRLGEEKSARAIARRIVAVRSRRQLTRTGELADLVVRVLGRERIAGRHAATRTFQALRIYVNDELGELAAALSAAERVLAPGGRLVVISFHSLEDRLVKHFLRRRAVTEQGPRHLPPRPSLFAPSFAFVNPHPVSPQPQEIAENSRARSAKLRAAERTGAPAWPPDDEPGWPRMQ